MTIFLTYCSQAIEKQLVANTVLKKIIVDEQYYI